MTDRERHAEEYRALLGRLERAYRMPANVRAQNTALLAKVAEECEAARVKAVCPWVWSGPVHDTDPLRVWCDEEFGTVHEIAKRRASYAEAA